MDFELDLNIWIGFKYWSKYLDLNFKNIQTSFLEKKNLDKKSDPIIWSKMDVDWIIKNPIHNHP